MLEIFKVQENAFDPSTNELMRSQANDFCMHVAWLIISTNFETLGRVGTRLATDKTRPANFYMICVRNVQMLLQHYRSGDLCIMGAKRRAAQLGTLRPDIRVSEMIKPGFDYTSLGLSHDLSTRVSFVNIGYIGTGKIPMNLPIDLTTASALPVLKIARSARHVQVHPVSVGSDISGLSTNF